MSTLIKWLHRIEDGAIVFLLVAMIGFAVLQIVLRNILDSGIIWGDPLLRQMVLWMALLGAMVAARQDKHISIDVLSRFLNARLKPYTDGIAKLATALICAIMTYFSVQFVLLELDSETIAFATVPSWLCVSIIPFAFAIMSLRYLLIAISSVINKPTLS